MPTASEMDQTIKELREAAAAINAAADRLARQSAGDDKRQNAETAADQQEKPKLSLADVRAVLADKSRAGYTDQVRELLHKYGASKLSAVDPKDYEALLNDAEGLNEF
jgi:F0F1-type ATP synthase membrane subunit b/b'